MIFGYPNAIPIVANHIWKHQPLGFHLISLMNIMRSWGKKPNELTGRSWGNTRQQWFLGWDHGEWRQVRLCLWSHCVLTIPLWLHLIFCPVIWKNGSHQQIRHYPLIVGIVQQHISRLFATRMPHRRSAQRLGQGTTSVSNTTIHVYGRVYVDKWKKKYFDLIQGSLPSS